MTTNEKILAAQQAWADGLVKIGKTAVSSPTEVKNVTNDMLNRLYDFNVLEPQILFKPTKAANPAIRINREDTLSYFIGGTDIKEDSGFALQPWKAVKFGDSYHIDEGNVVMVMGVYTFVDYQNNEVEVDYTFGYRTSKDSDELKIFLHHSSLPFKPIG